MEILQKDEEDSEEDPLDAFMNGIHDEIARDKNKKDPPADICGDDDDDEHNFLDSRNSKRMKMSSSSIESTDLSVKGNLLPIIDHSQISYSVFPKNLYVVDESVLKEEMDKVLENMKLNEMELSLMTKNGVQDLKLISAFKPISKFEHLRPSIGDLLMNVIVKKGYEIPTPIQRLTLGVTLGGNDVIAMAKTGSGKTLAYVLSMMVHVSNQPRSVKKDGPVGLVLAPTRELAQQIYREAKPFAVPLKIRIQNLVGGLGKYEQCKALKAGCCVIIATPGRLIDMVRMKATNLRRCTFLVLDEADRMFDMGFEPQVRAISSQIRPDRQTLLYSATMPPRIEAAARETLFCSGNQVVRANTGHKGCNMRDANEDIVQIVEVLPTTDAKDLWLFENIQRLVFNDSSNGSSIGSSNGEPITSRVLVFAGQKQRCDEICELIANKFPSFRVASLHGDKDQLIRQKIMFGFKSGSVSVLISTDVAARGLDIKGIDTVVNLDVPRNMEAHVHRLGRTGRAGKKGRAFTLLTPKDASFAFELKQSLERLKQPISPVLCDLANRAPGKGKEKRGRGKRKIGKLATSRWNSSNQDSVSSGSRQGLGFQLKQSPLHVERKKNAYGPFRHGKISFQKASGGSWESTNV